ncbi:MAG: hypothetical protein AAB356_04065, partial [Deltaproteobacteria bacterium]
ESLDDKMEIEGLLHSAFLDTDSILFTWRLRLKSRIYALAEDCSFEGWDGYGSLPVFKDAINAAERFVDLLPEGVMEPFITAENTGDMAFDWDIGEDMTFAVIISGYHAVYAGIFGDSSRRGTERIHSELPGTIKDVLLTYFRKKT